MGLSGVLRLHPSRRPDHLPSIGDDEVARTLAQIAGGTDGLFGTVVVHDPNRVQSTAKDNSFAERFVLSIKSECLSKIIPLSERHLRWAIREYSAHYHEERPHQGIGNVIIDPPPRATNDDGEIVCTERLGVLKHFRRSAA